MQKENKSFSQTNMYEKESKHERKKRREKSDHSPNKHYFFSSREKITVREKNFLLSYHHQMEGGGDFCIEENFMALIEHGHGVALMEGGNKLKLKIGKEKNHQSLEKFSCWPPAEWRRQTENASIWSVQYV